MGGPAVMLIPFTTEPMVEKLLPRLPRQTAFVRRGRSSRGVPTVTSSSRRSSASPSSSIRRSAGGAFGAAEEARGIVERIREYGVSEERLSSLEARLESYLESRDGDVPTESGEEARPVPILFMGGDERQAKVQDDVRDAVAETDPNVSVTFVHPGWSGNWGGTLDTVLGKVKSHDGVVIMRFVRTEFGRQLRASLGDTPWRQCPGAGRRTMAESVLLAAEAARQHLDRLDRSIKDGARTAGE